MSEPFTVFSAAYLMKRYSVPIYAIELSLMPTENVIQEFCCKNPKYWMIWVKRRRTDKVLRDNFAY